MILSKLLCPDCGGSGMDQARGGLCVGCSGEGKRRQRAGEEVLYGKILPAKSTHADSPGAGWGSCPCQRKVAGGCDNSCDFD